MCVYACVWYGHLCTPTLCVHTTCVLWFVCVCQLPHPLTVPSIDCFSSQSTPRAGRRRFWTQQHEGNTGRFVPTESFGKGQSHYYSINCSLLKTLSLYFAEYWCQLLLFVYSVTLERQLFKIKKCVKNISDSDHSFFFAWFVCLTIHPLPRRPINKDDHLVPWQSIRASASGS